MAFPTQTPGITLGLDFDFDQSTPDDLHDLNVSAPVWPDGTDELPPGSGDTPDYSNLTIYIVLRVMPETTATDVALVSRFWLDKAAVDAAVDQPTHKVDVTSNDPQTFGPFARGDVPRVYFDAGRMHMTVQYEFLTNI